MANYSDRELYEADDGNQGKNEQSVQIVHFPKICGACECEIDEDGICGCDPWYA